MNRSLHFRPTNALLPILIFALIAQGRLGKAADPFDLDIDFDFRLDGADPMDLSGTSLAAADINGDLTPDFVIGAPGASNNGRPSSGSVFVVFGDATLGNTSGSTASLALLGGAGTPGGFRIDGAAAFDKAGQSVATGDVNGDGRQDIIIGAPGVDGTASTTDAGATFVVFTPTPAQLALLPKDSTGVAFVDLAQLNQPAGLTGLQIRGPDRFDRAGEAVAASDLNADGRADIVVGVPFADKAVSPVTGLAAQRGTASGMLTDGTTYFYRVTALGVTTLTAGETTSSPEVIVIAGPTGSVELSWNPVAGATGYRIYRGTNAGIADTFLPLSGAANAFIDAGVSGTFGQPPAVTDAGAAFIVLGQTGTGVVDLAMPGLNVRRISGPFRDPLMVSGSQAGFSVAAGGDFDGDGKPDVAIGARSFAYNPGATFTTQRFDSGATYVLLDAAGAMTDVDLGSTSSSLIPIFGARGARAGSAVAFVGDMNGDGRADLAVGARNDEPGGRYRAGSVNIVYGRTPATLTSDDNGLQRIDLTTLAASGEGIVAVGPERAEVHVVSGIGDFNGDGCPDVGIGGPAGRVAFVLFGPAGPTPGMCVTPAAAGRTIDLTLVGKLGNTQGLAFFRGSFSELGTAVAGGDLDGDGRADMIVGDPDFSSVTAAGAVWLNRSSSRSFTTGRLDGFVTGAKPSGFQQPLAGAQIDVCDASGNCTLVTTTLDPTGKARYSLRGLAPGRYSITAKPPAPIPPGFDPDLGPSKVFNVTLGAGDRSQVNVALVSQFATIGVFVKEYVTPGGLANAPIRLCQPAGACPPTLTAVTNAGGFADVGRIPPGLYVLKVDPPVTRPDLVPRTIGPFNLAAGDRPPRFNINLETRAFWGNVGSIGGTVTASGLGAVNGAQVQICDVVATPVCRVSTTNTSGRFLETGLSRFVQWSVKVLPPPMMPNAAPVTVTPIDIFGGNVTNLTINLTDMTVPPPGTTTTASMGANGIQADLSNVPLGVSTGACANGTGTFEVRMDNAVIQRGSLSETPPGSGIYAATIPPTGRSGIALVILRVTCRNGSTFQVGFDVVYIDPSGTVRDASTGNPVDGASVTLFRSDTASGPFTPVPDGATTMSLANRRNPHLTNANGQFGWDVIAGFYVVRAEKDGCVSPTNPSQTFVQSAVLTIPPPVTDLDLRLNCVSDRVAPTTTRTISPVPNDAGWNKDPVTVRLTAVDNPDGSGVLDITYSAAGAQPIAETTVAGDTVTIPIAMEGDTTISYRASDRAGNVEAVQTVTVRLDMTAPFARLGAQSPAPNPNGWNNGPVMVSFQCTDGLSGLAAGSPPAPTVLSGEGAHQSASGTCVDMAGNSASATVDGINIDLTPPLVACGATPDQLWPPSHKLVDVSFRVTVEDALSGATGFTLASVESNEPDNGLGDGDTADDIQGFTVGTPDSTGFFRAERSGKGTGRRYTIGYVGADKAGNSAACSAVVAVPHDQSRR